VDNLVIFNATAPKTKAVTTTTIIMAETLVENKKLGSIIAHMDIARSAFEETMNATNVYMRAKKLPPEYVYFVISILLESKNIQLTNIHIYRIPFSRIPLFQ